MNWEKCEWARGWMDNLIDEEGGRWLWIKIMELTSALRWRLRLTSLSSKLPFMMLRARWASSKWKGVGPSEVSPERLSTPELFELEASTVRKRGASRPKMRCEVIPRTVHGCAKLASEREEEDGREERGARRRGDGEAREPRRPTDAATRRMAPARVEKDWRRRRRGKERGLNGRGVIKERQATERKP